MTREIPLNKGMKALVDDADYGVLSQYNWYALQDSDRWYAYRSVELRPRSHPDGRKTQRISMHRQILCPPDGLDVDHANHNGLDNRRENIRSCTRSQNSANMRPRREGQFRGVYRSGNKWLARVSGYPASPVYLGTFETAEEAALAYDAAAHIRFGKFATLNFPVAAQ